VKAFVLFGLCSALALAQSKPAGSGHWEGTMSPPGMSASFSVDLAKNDKGIWIGDMDIPDRNMKDAPLSKIAVDGAKVTFALGTGISFAADLAPDGKSMKGDATAGPNTFPFDLKWISEPNVVLPAKSPAVSKEFEGVWNGVITTPDGNALRVQLTLANTPDGATGTAVSLDQGNAELAVSPIKQDGKKLAFEMKIAGAAYSGELNAAGTEMTGTFTQGEFSTQLTFKKAN
jgi:hypothetical protein